MEKAYPEQKSHNLKMVSQYGQNYMKNQMREAQERKSHKLSTQIKRDPDGDKEVLKAQRQI